MTRVSLLVAAALAASLVPAAHAGPRDHFRSGGVYAIVSADEVTLGNPLVERRWRLGSFSTTALVDKRGRDYTWGSTHRDFTLELSGVPIGSESFSTESVEVSELRAGGLRVTFHLVGPGIDATRTVEAYNGIAGFYATTVLEPLIPAELSGVTLDEVAVGGDAAAMIHAYRAGADRREPGWDGPSLSVGDPHAGTWRDTRRAELGADLSGAAQWVSVGKEGRSLFVVAERNDLPSSRASYSDGIASVEVDHGRDVVVLGPFEEDAHVENPAPVPARHRLLLPGGALALPPAFTGVALHGDDEPWQYHKFLLERRLDPYDHAIVFNSNGTDGNVRSTGAKDDMDYETILEVAPTARDLGIETFVLDDGWQAISGDWFPDCPEHSEPRWNGEPGSKFRPRFPDCDFAAVREAIAPMELGLWMSPMHFNPSSQTYRSHPEWACTPVGHALAGVNALDPNSGSNEAGIGMWSPAAIPHIRSRIADAIENWGVTYFKFDFLVWVDCAGQGDFYDYHDAFVAMLDDLQATYPEVTFQIDETNDYRLFPFESVTRGPSWFQNGSPAPERLLHNVWNLSPYVPAYSLGQHFLGGRAWERYPVDTLMAAALTSHPTFFSDLRSVPAEVVHQARAWTDSYSAHRDLFAQMVYPLLDDPIDGGWTALQPWQPEQGRGALLVFRQDSPEASTTVALRNVPEGMTFDVFEAPTGARVATYTSEQLSSGIDISLPEPRTARVLLVLPAAGVSTR